MFFLDLIQNLFPNLNIYLFPLPKTMFGTLISPEISGFENLNGAFSPQNSSLFFVETACQNLKSENFFSKFSIPNMV